MSTGAVVLEARNLGRTYLVGTQSVHALQNVDLDLRQGELLVLLGASGSGKSTLLNILGGLDRPTAGTLRYRDMDLTRIDDGALTLYRRRHVGVVFQLYNLIPSLTARENVALVSEIAEDPIAPEDALGMVGLGDRLDHFPAQLSGGEQQRVAIARAVTKRPDLLLCDEPTGALDAATGRLVLQVIDQVNQETGAATAIITHNRAIGGIGDRLRRPFGERGRYGSASPNGEVRNPWKVECAWSRAPGIRKVSALGVEEQRVDVVGDLLEVPHSLGTGYQDCRSHRDVAGLRRPDRPDERDLPLRIGVESLSSRRRTRGRISRRPRAT